MDLSEEILLFSVTGRNNKLLDTYHQKKPSSLELKFRSDLQSLQNHFMFEIMILNLQNVVQILTQFRLISSIKSGYAYQLHDTIQVPNISPIEEKEALCVKRTHSFSADTEFGSDVAGNENGKREIHDELKCHFEDLVDKMMKKQEDMYKVLLKRQDDMYKVLLGKIEQKEKYRITREGTWRNLEMERMRKETEQMKKDRITREETWRNLEMETMRKEEDRRAQDTHLSLALGQQVVNTPESTRKQIISIPQSPKITLHDQSGQKKQGLQKWPKHEVHALISLRMEMQHKLLSCAAKFRMWEEISLGMASMGFTRTAKKCKAKWEFINRYFKRAAGIGEKGAENAAKACPYFQEMDMFYKQCLVEAET
ncbi:hypothetical protein MKW92_044509 [Papaver armeniacum]|nr:hypothetical protein MKW92_044509 [Papaver armeniacum]